MLEFNTSVFGYFSQFTEIPFLGVIADGPIFFLPLFLVALWLFYTYYKKNNTQRLKLLYIFYSCCVGIFLSFVIKQFVDFERPDVYLESTTNLILSTIPEKSFPSDHATVSFAFATALYFTGYKKVFFIFLPFVIIMNLARIAVGVHWPLDILAGSILGVFSSYLFFTYLSQFRFVKKLDGIIIQCMKYLRLY